MRRNRWSVYNVSSGPLTGVKRNNKTSSVRSGNRVKLKTAKITFNFFKLTLL